MSNNPNSSAKSATSIPQDNPKRALTVSRADDHNAQHIGLVGDTYTILLTGKDTAGRFCLIDMHVPPSGGPPPHRHDFEESFIVLEGEIEVTFRGAKSLVNQRRNHQHSRQRPAPIPQCQHPTGTPTLHLLSRGARRVFRASRHSRRHPHYRPTQTRRQSPGGIQSQSSRSSPQIQD